MIPLGPGYNMNIGTQCRVVYPVVWFDDTHTYTVFLMKCACTWLVHSFNVKKSFFCFHNSLGWCLGDRLYVLSYPRTSNRSHFFQGNWFFRHIHYRMVQLQMQQGCISSLWWNESFLTMTSPSRFAVSIRNICPVYSGQIPLCLSGNKLKQKPCLPYFSWMTSRSSLFLTHLHPELKVIIFNFWWETLSKSICDILGHEAVSKMTITCVWHERLT